jgi:hypothetical protein
MLKITNLLLSFAVLGATACHPGPVLSAKLPANGTIAGIVSSTANAAVPDHKVTAVDVTTGARFDATTGVNGGYTIKLPEGTYRLEIELRPGEVVTKQPGETRVHKSDLDPHRDFTIALKGPAQ